MVLAVRCSPCGARTRRRARRRAHRGAFRGARHGARRSARPPRARARSPAAGSFGGAPVPVSPPGPVPRPGPQALHVASSSAVGVLPAMVPLHLLSVASPPAPPLTCGARVVARTRARRVLGAWRRECTCRSMDRGSATSSLGIYVNLAVRCAAPGSAVARGARCCSVFFPASATGEVGWSTQHEISNPSLSPPPPHTVPAASTYLAACSPPGAPPSGAPRRAGGHRIAQMLFRDGGGPAGFVDRLTERFSGRRRHRARSSRRFLI